MPIDPQIRVLLDKIAQAGVPELDALPLELARTRGRVPESLTGPPDPVALVEDRMIPGPSGGMRLRLYHPDDGGRLGALVYFHGGGHVIGSIETHDHLCRSFAARGQCVVVSVDYRLAPEHPFPAGIDDAYAATRWVATNADALAIDAERLAVGGDSAGGNLAAATALRARDEGGPALAFQLLLYASTTSVWNVEDLDPALETPMLTRRMKQWFRRQHCPSEADAFHRWASPLRADSLAGLPPAFVLTAEYDLLRDQGEEYARRLEDAGVPVTLRRYEGMVHGFLHFPGIVDGARRAIDEVAAVLRAALGNAPSPRA